MDVQKVVSAGCMRELYLKVASEGCIRKVVSERCIRVMHMRFFDEGCISETCR